MPGWRDELRDADEGEVEANERGRGMIVRRTGTRTRRTRETEEEDGARMIDSSGMEKKKLEKI